MDRSSLLFIASPFSESSKPELSVSLAGEYSMYRISEAKRIKAERYFGNSNSN
jgi:hypothetical protein